MIKCIFSDDISELNVFNLTKNVVKMDPVTELVPLSLQVLRMKMMRSGRVRHSALRSVCSVPPLAPHWKTTSTTCLSNMASSSQMLIIWSMQREWSPILVCIFRVKKLQTLLFGRLNFILHTFHAMCSSLTCSVIVEVTPFAICFLSLC